MQKLLIIVGPTATGKTKLSIWLAEKLNGEIVSADSRQIYKQLDIGTGKDITKAASFSVQNAKFKISKKKYTLGYYHLNNIKVWLYDVVAPDQKFSAAEYANLAMQVIENIWQRRKLPLLVGGAGFYIQAALEGIPTAGFKPDWNLRETLGNLTVGQLQQKLSKLAPAKLSALNKSDRNNPRRLIRALEIAGADISGQPANKNIKTATKQSVHSLAKISNVLQIGLRAPTKKLYARIDKRVDKRVCDGIIEEIKNLLAKGYTWDDPGFNTIGYKEWQAYFAGKHSFADVIRRWKYAEHAYARRQLTWLNKNQQIKWFDLTQAGYIEKIAQTVKKWYHQNENDPTN